jgi:hypothetical protein
MVVMGPWVVEEKSEEMKVGTHENICLSIYTDSDRSD